MQKTQNYTKEFFKQIADLINDVIIQAKDKSEQEIIKNLCNIEQIQLLINLSQNNDLKKELLAVKNFKQFRELLKENTNFGALNLILAASQELAVKIRSTQDSLSTSIKKMNCKQILNLVNLSSIKMTDPNKDNNDMKTRIGDYDMYKSDMMKVDYEIICKSKTEVDDDDDDMFNDNFEEEEQKQIFSLAKDYDRNKQDMTQEEKTKSQYEMQIFQVLLMFHALKRDEKDFEELVNKKKNQMILDHEKEVYKSFKIVMDQLQKNKQTILDLLLSHFNKNQEINEKICAKIIRLNCSKKLHGDTDQLNHLNNSLIDGIICSIMDSVNKKNTASKLIQEYGSNRKIWVNAFHYEWRLAPAMIDVEIEETWAAFTSNKEENAIMK
jgi:hypothetical protein